MKNICVILTVLLAVIMFSSCTTFHEENNIAGPQVTDGETGKLEAVNKFSIPVTIRLHTGQEKLLNSGESTVWELPANKEFYMEAYAPGYDTQDEKFMIEPDKQKLFVVNSLTKLTDNPTQGIFVVNTMNMQGADIYVINADSKDTVAIGYSSDKFYLPGGDYFVRLSHQDYRPFYGQVQVINGRRTALDVRMVPKEIDSGKEKVPLVVTTNNDPVNYIVTNGYYSYQGKTPIDLSAHDSVEVGVTVTATVSKNGLTIQDTKTAQSGNVLKFHFDFPEESPSTGSVMMAVDGGYDQVVLYSYPGADSVNVMLDGEVVYFNGLSAGDYSLAVHKAGYKSKNIPFSVTAGQTAILSTVYLVKLPDNTAEVAVMDNKDGGSRVEIDGNYVGNTNSYFTVIADQIHEIKVTRDGYADQKDWVKLSAGELKTLTFNFIDSPDPVVIRSFTGPDTVEADEVFTLSWASSGADNAIINGIGPVTTSGSVSDVKYASGEYAYTLEVSGPGGQASKSLTVFVKEKLQDNEAQLAIKDNKGGGSKIYINGSYVGDTDNVFTIIANQVLEIKVTRTGYVDQKNWVKLNSGELKTLTFNFIDSPDPVVINLFTGPDTAMAGEPFTLQWTSSGATSAVISGIGIVPTNGSVTEVKEASGVYYYTLEVSGPGGITHKTIKVYVKGGYINPTLDAWVRFSSAPAGAKVYLDGYLQNYQTNTGWIKLQPGFHTYSYELDGYQPWHSAFTVVPGDSMVVHKDLDPSSPGETLVNITSNVTATVTLDSMEIGTTPIYNYAVEPGWHLVILQADGYQTVVMAFKAIEGVVNELYFELQPVIISPPVYAPKLWWQVDYDDGQPNQLRKVSCKKYEINLESEYATGGRIAVFPLSVDSRFPLTLDESEVQSFYMNDLQWEERNIVVVAKVWGDGGCAYAATYIRKGVIRNYVF